LHDYLATEHHQHPHHDGHHGHGHGHGHNHSTAITMTDGRSHRDINTLNDILLRDAENRLRNTMHTYRDRVSDRAELLLELTQPADNAIMAATLHNFIANTMHSLEEVGVSVILVLSAAGAHTCVCSVQSLSAAKVNLIHSRKMIHLNPF
jgi:hypothetical protein